METVDEDSYYGPLLRQRLTAWAGFGEYVHSHLALGILLTLYARSISGSNGMSTSAPANIRLNLRPPTG